MFTKRLAAGTILLLAAVLFEVPGHTQGQPAYERPETRALVALVSDAAALVREKGEAAFQDFGRPGSRWRDRETYIFVIDPAGNMLVHADPALEGKNQLDLEDVNGKPIVRGLLGAALGAPDRPGGWYHYEWPVPGGLLPRWKSSYVQRVQTPSGRQYIVGSGMYNDEMERAFVVDAVTRAAHDIERHGRAAFPRFHDPKGPFIFKDAYVFVVDMDGTELVNPAFPNLEGRNIRDVEDAQGKPLVREMLETVQTRGSGWVDYLWPKPGESDPTRKSAYVTTARLGDRRVLVGAGVYLADAPTVVSPEPTMTASELRALVRDAAAVFAREGEDAYPRFRERGSKWFHDDTYFYVWTLSGTRVFHAANPESEGEDVRNLTDIVGKPIGRMFPDAVSGPTGEGWVHYMWPEPDDIFPQWKSSFMKRVTFPSGEQVLIGAGIYNMEMDRVFIEDVVDRAAARVAAQGQAAFPALRDPKGPFVFMDTYVFVTHPSGVELVNPAHPGLEGTNIAGVRDIRGTLLVRDYVNEALEKGEAWVDYFWYRPGENTPAQKHTYVRKVRHGPDTYIVGSGFYPRAEAADGEPQREGER